jgi:hypothetical protein
MQLLKHENMTVLTLFPNPAFSSLHHVDAEFSSASQEMKGYCLGSVCLFWEGPLFFFKWEGVMSFCLFA